MKPCPSCKARLADNAQTCPHCGKRFTSPIVVILAVIFAALFIWKFLAGS